MGPIRRLVLRFATSLRSNKAERDLSREISAHLQLLEEDFVAKGMPREEARYAAKRAFGGVEQAKELQRDARSFRWLAGWPMDLKLGARMMIKSPGLTVIAVFALALAIAAGAAYLEFVNDLIRPSLSSAGGERVVGIRLWDVEQRKTQTRTMHEFAVWRAESTTLEHVGAHRPLNLPLVTDDGRADAVRGVEISAEAFRLFPAMPLMGRTLTDADEQHGAPPVVIIGHDLWKSRFDSDPNIIGRTVQLGPAHYTVVGVMPAQFGFPLNQNLWTPLKTQTAGLRSGEGPAIRMFAGLKAGMTVEAAQAELSGMMTGHPRGMRADVRPYIESLLAAESSRASIQKVLDSANLLFVMLLAICGANIATLVFARTATRESEITVRTALGASRGRISAQLFAEALVLSLVAALAGLALAGFLGRWLGMLFVQGTGQTLPFWWNANLSLPTVLYALALAVFTALIVGVIPALKATGAQLQSGLRDAGAGGSTLKFGRMWTGVIVTQVAITVVFLSALVSLGWSTFRGQTDRDVTFSRDRFWTAQLVDPGGAEAEEVRAAFRALAGKLRSEPGVVNVTYATEMPGTTSGRFPLEFATPDVASSAIPHDDGLWSRSARVGLNYFETVGIPLVAGRLFSESEIESGRPVAIVDETFVRLILGGRNAVGLMVRERADANDAAPGPWHEIVGVVSDVTIKEKNSYDGMLYEPAALAASPVYLFVRTQTPAAAMSQRLQEVSAAQTLRVAGVRTLDRVAYDEVLAERVFLRVFAIVAAIALLLSTAGIYALVSFTLARRTREIGIRVALGAAPRRIIAGTFSRAFMQIVAGVAAGFIPSAVILMAGAEDTGGLQGPGLLVTLAVGAFVVLVAMVSCAVPLRRALRIQPMDALRAN